MSIDKLSPETQKTVELLLRCNVAPVKVAAETGVALVHVNEMANFHLSKTFSTTLNTKDAELADAARELAWKAFNVANETLQFGSPADRMMLARGIVNRSMTLIGAEKTSKLDELRDSFNELIGATNSPDELDYDLPEDQDAIEIGTVAEYTDDPR